MKKILLIFIILISSIMNAQITDGENEEVIFTFLCIDPAIEAGRLAEGLANASWTPSFISQKNNFIQTKSFETVTATRTIEVTKFGGEWELEYSAEYLIVGAISGVVGFDLNGDGDQYDGIFRGFTRSAVYTASHDLGSFIVPASGIGGWQIGNDFNTPTGAYEHALDNQPPLNVTPDDTWTRIDYENALRSIGEEVQVAYINQILIIDEEPVITAIKYHTIKVGAWEWDNHYTKTKLQDLAWDGWLSLTVIVQTEVLKLRYDIPQTVQREDPTDEELATLRAERMQKIYDIGHGYNYDVYYEYHNGSDAFYPGTAFSLGIRVRTNDYGSPTIEGLTTGGWANYLDAWKAELYRYELWLRAATCSFIPALCN